jgi:hypothetical protein
VNARGIALALYGRRAQRLADGSYLVPCPVLSHGKGRGDRNPSLRIGDGASRLLVRCYSGCDPRDVLDVLRRRGLLDGAPREKDCNLPAGDSAPPPRDSGNLPNQDFAERIWRQSQDIAGTHAESYLARRGIVLDDVPNLGGLRWHPHCPWERGTAPCVLARYTDARTAEPRGIWRRPIDGNKPMTLGPMRGCVIRLWPDEDMTTHLVLGEGVETAAAASQIEHKGTLLQPMWAAGSAVNMARFPVLPGIEALTLIVDNDKSGTGQQAAATCARRWIDAGREVIRLTPKMMGADFNDIIRNGSAA